MNIKLCFFFAFIGTISAQGIIDTTCQGIRSQYLSDKGNLIQRCDGYFFTIYNRLKTITDNIIAPSTRYLQSWNITCTNFAKMNKTKGTRTVNNYCTQIMGALKYPSEAQKSWMVSFYYNELGMNTDFIDAAADIWVGIEDHLNSILDLQQKNPDCVRVFARNYSSIYMPYFTVIYNVYAAIINNQSSFFKRSTDFANLVPTVVYNLYTSLNTCINNTDAANCISKFIATNVNDCQTSGCRTPYDAIQLPAKTFIDDLARFKDFYDSQIILIKNNYSIIEDNMNAWTQSVNDCILNSGSSNLSSTTTTVRPLPAVAASNVTATATSNITTATTIRPATINGSAPSVINATTLSAVNGSTTSAVLTTTAKLGNGPATVSTPVPATTTTVKGNSTDQKVKSSNQAAAAASQNGKPVATTTTTKQASTTVRTAVANTTKAVPTTVRATSTTIKPGVSTTATKQLPTTAKATSTTIRSGVTTTTTKAVPTTRK